MQFSKPVSEGRTAFAAGASSQAPKKGEKAAAPRSKEPEIVVLNTAADVVKGWIEAEGASEGEEDAPPEPELRAPRLGLGAKYLPHAKVSSNLGTLEKRLRAKIDTSARGGSEDEAGAPSSKKKKTEGDARDGSNGANVLEKGNESGSDDDEEEERGGRGCAFQKKQRGLPAFEAIQSKKAKKRKKKKRDEVSR